MPYRPRPVEQTYDQRGSRWRMWETEDQRFVDNRPDVVSWVSAPLDQDLTIAGDVTARLVASTTGRDADWVVKLIDVFPDSMPDDWKLGGYELMVAHEIMRGRYRKSFTAPRAARAQHPARLHGGPAPAGLHLQAGAQADGAGAEHLVPALRPEPADLGAQHLQGEGVGLQGADAPGVAHGGAPVAGGGDGPAVSGERATELSSRAKRRILPGRVRATCRQDPSLRSG